MYNAEILRFTQSNYNHGKTNSTQGICLKDCKFKQVFKHTYSYGQKQFYRQGSLDEVCLFQSY